MTMIRSYRRHANLRIRNANMVKHETLELPASNIKKQIAEISKQEGFIRDVEYIEDNKQGKIKFHLNTPKGEKSN